MLTKSDIDWLKGEFLPSLANEVENRLKQKLDDISTKLDKFVGDVETKRTEQKLHAEQHRKTNDRFEKIDKHLRIDTSV